MKNLKDLIAAATVITAFAIAPNVFAANEYNISKGTTIDGTASAFGLTISSQSVQD